MNKCEWKDGKFIACELWLKNRIHDFHHYVREDVTYCPFCGADIRKPEQEESDHIKAAKLIIRILSLEFYDLARKHAGEVFEDIPEMQEIFRAAKIIEKYFEIEVVK